MPVPGLSMRCAAELCQYWTGEGCICEVFGLSDDDEYVHWECSHCHASGRTKSKPYLCPVCQRPL